MAGEYNPAVVTNRLRTIPVTLSAFGTAGDRQSYNILNRYFTVLDATFQTQTDLNISLDDDPFADAFKGLQLDFKESPVNKVTILNLNASPNTVRMAFSAIPIFDNRTTVTGNVGISGGAALSAPTSFVTAADQSIVTATATKIYTGTALTKEIFVQNLEASGGVSMRIGDSNVGAARGILIQPQQIIVLDVGAVTTGDVWCYHAKGSNATVGVQAIS
jgi:hypothetical protein